MKKKYEEILKAPEGVICEVVENTLNCKKGDVELQRVISVPELDVSVKDDEIKFLVNKANKRTIAMIKSNISHVKNILRGFDEKYVYKMEICNVHFPMTAKVEKNNLVVNNFLGEKINRIAEILEGVNVEVKGKEVIVSGRDIEKAGQTAANIERATRVPKKDKRVFQDGIFITEKPGGKI